MLQHISKVYICHSHDVNEKPKLVDVLKDIGCNSGPSEEYGNVS